MNRRTAAKTIGAACASAWLGNSQKLGAEAGVPAQVQQLGTAAATAAPPASIAVNQCGYRPEIAKVASIAVPPGGRDPESFVVEAVPDGKVVFEGKLALPLLDAASGDHVAVADFSAVRTPGTYRVRAGDGVSDPVVISEMVYKQPLTLAMRAFYGQRCGCKVDLGGGYKHKACHKKGEFHGSSGRSGKLKNTGGWHDAGDYGRYVVNSGISTATLLWAFEMFPEVLETLPLQIPESGHGVPDFLAEVRWNLRWMMSLQDEADGGVWHKQTSEAFCGFVMPEKDKLTSEVIGTGSAPFKSTCATADFAAVMAVAARCYGRFDAAFAAACLQAGRRAFQWAQANPAVVFHNPAGVTTGEYGDPKCSDELMWAAAELWRTTGEQAFRDAFEAGVPEDLTVSTPSWGGVLSLAFWAYAMSGRSGTPGVRERIVAGTRLAAAQRVERSKGNGYGNTLGAADYVWGSNSSVGNDAILLLISDHFGGDPPARRAALENLHYLLGRNCFRVSWVTGVGARPFQHPHHRPSQADKVAAPWPGLLSGGPNAHGGDTVANALPKGPPMRMWVDDYRAYSVNEVAINWNAPLVFLLAAANASPRE